MKRRQKRRRKRGESVNTVSGGKKRTMAKAGKPCGEELPFLL